jgi:hypothetical protein
MHKKLLTFDTERQIPQEKNEGILHSAMRDLLIYLIPLDRCIFHIKLHKRVYIFCSENVMVNLHI